MGSKSDLLRTLAAISGVKSATGGVRSSVLDWRRRRDSNPRYGFPHTHFPGVRLQPLGHPSAPASREAARITPWRVEKQGRLAIEIAKPLPMQALALEDFARESVQRGEAMLRFVVRVLGLVLLAGAFAAAVIDGARSLADQKVVLTAMGTLLSAAFPSRFVALEAAAAKLPKPIWDPVLTSILFVPAFVDLGVIGFLLMALTMRGSASSRLGA